MSERDAWQTYFSLGAQVDWRTLGDDRVNGRNSVECVIIESAILISAQFNISPVAYFSRYLLSTVTVSSHTPHYSFMVLCLTTAIWLSGSAYCESTVRLYGRLSYRQLGFLLFRGRSCQPLRHIHHWISRKPWAIEAWFQRTTNINRKWHMGYQMITLPMTSHDPERSNSWSPQMHQYVRAQYLENGRRKPSDGMGYQNGHVTDDVTLPQKVLWASTVGYPSHSLASF